jgi:hypothetical protein
MSSITGPQLHTLSSTLPAEAYKSKRKVRKGINREAGREAGRKAGRAGRKAGREGAEELWHADAQSSAHTLRNIRIRYTTSTLRTATPSITHLSLGS